GHQDFGVLLLAEEPADRHGNVARGERRGRHLIEQRLKDVVVRPIEDRHVNGGVAQRSRGVQAAESRADDHDARFRARGTHDTRAASTTWGCARLKTIPTTTTVTA